MMVVASCAALVFSLSPDDPNNLIKNGGFDKDTVDTWVIYCHHGAAGNGGVVNGELVFHVTTAGAYYDAQAFTTAKNWASLENGKEYFLSFDAKSDVARTLIFAVEDGVNYNPAEYNANGGAKNPINITTTMQTFTSTFTMEKPSATNARIVFNSGASVSTLTFDNVVLIEKSKIVAIRPQLTINAESNIPSWIDADSKGLCFHSADPANFGYRIYSLSGKQVVNSGTFSQGSAARYRIDFRSLGISSGRYVAQAVEGNQIYSKIFSVMP
jgi:hypothetical protein